MFQETATAHWQAFFPVPFLWCTALELISFFSSFIIFFFVEFLCARAGAADG